LFCEHYGACIRSRRNEDAVRRYHHHIGGRAVPASDVAPLQRHAPATGQLVAEYDEAGSETIHLAVQAGRRAFDEGPWPRMPAPERARVLRRLAALVADNADRLAELDSEEVGKPLRFARAEVDGAVAMVEHAAALAADSTGEAWTDLREDLVAYSSREPAGVAALIIPWNFPLLTVSQKLPFALAAGCTVIVKPSEFTSSSVLELARLAEEAGVPTGVVNVVTGTGRKAGAALVAHPGVDVVSFTGSSATGRDVMALAARGPKRVGLELGGKAANIIFADADLDAAVANAVFAAFFNMGECCVSGPRLLLHEPIADEVLDRIVTATSALQVGLPTGDGVDLGPLITATHHERVRGFVERARGEAELIVGDAPLPDELAGGHFFRPTIFDDVKPGSELFTDEVFGPVLGVTRFRGTEDAVTLANATPYGLANALWTSNLETALDVSKALRSGTVWVNTNLDGSPSLPFTGRGASGFGSEVGREGFNEFTEYKVVQLRTKRRPTAFEPTTVSP
jgi:betaine-aldehyde dehydrogenase